MVRLPDLVPGDGLLDMAPLPGHLHPLLRALLPRLVPAGFLHGPHTVLLRVVPADLLGFIEASLAAASSTALPWFIPAGFNWSLLTLGHWTLVTLVHIPALLNYVDRPWSRGDMGLGRRVYHSLGSRVNDSLWSRRNNSPRNRIGFLDTYGSPDLSTNSTGGSSCSNGLSCSGLDNTATNDASNHGRNNDRSKGLTDQVFLEEVKS